MKQSFLNENYLANCNSNLDSLGVPPVNFLHLDASVHKAWQVSSISVALEKMIMNSDVQWCINEKFFGKFCP